MIRSIVLAVATVSLTCAYIQDNAEAASNMIVQINGENISSPVGCGNPTEVVLSACDGTSRTYQGKGIKIEGATAGTPAKVTTTDGPEDKLKLVSAKITATQNQAINCDANNESKYMNCTNIFISAVFDSGPDGNAADIPYYRESFGTMRRGANPASGSSFRITGWINDLNNPGDKQIGYVQKKLICASPATCQSVDFGQTGVMLHPSLTGQRELKVQLWFGLKFTNDVLTLTSAHDATSAGGGDGAPVGKGSVMILNDSEEGDDGRDDRKGSR